MIGVAVLGNGVVGTGVCAILRENARALSLKCGDALTLRHVFVRRSYPECPYPSLLTKDFMDIINDNNTHIVVEAMGGVDPAYDMVSLALSRKKSVVTSNKHLIAEHGQELLELARQNNVKLLFEAAVGGAIPIIRPLHRCLAANRVEEIQGVLNGTCNFILTQMERREMPFLDALRLAQRLGYAETDPTADINGTDTCRKICILASLAFGYNVSPAHVHMEGISSITPTDMDYAGSFGYSIKLVAHAINGFDGSAQIIVAPHLISFSNPLYAVNDVFNGVAFTTNYSGQIFLSGKGAGSFPTAGAVVGDIVECADCHTPQATLGWSKVPCNVDAIPQYVSPFYVRCKGRHTLKGVIPLCESDSESAFITTPMSRANLSKWLLRHKLEPLSVFWVLE